MLKFLPILSLAFACGTGTPAEHDVAAEASPPVETAGWPYETLNAEERAVIDRGRDVAGWHGVQRHFADAVRENAQRAQNIAGTVR